ncbi:MAG TPA: hypothetical protein IGS52_15875 [Oscillatoriaceae cyanobacterium M33_DOE_052]|uniref:Uncharacterized protein n=1 Tax=Planktothricoides sp. SpSt-374 TaxID=2282167 RepID=A0A7C3VU26_9CYAN|nr:hypothetical protein [Oscillatoriaceae cyanobacterium M33_DOE_052]
MTIVRKFVFCEGQETSLDYQLLDKVLQLPANIEIVPSGGKFAFSDFARGYFFPAQMQDQSYIIFRDRDFDALPSPNVRLIPGANRRIWMTHRACIENYLLEPELIHAYWQAKYAEKQENPTAKWGHGDSPGIEAISQWIESSARSLQYYQAVRWALGDLLRMTGARSQLRTTWTGGSGNLPDSLEIEECKTAARQEIIEPFRRDVEAITVSRFESGLAEYLAQFAGPDFWHNKAYIIWFHGKDIQKQMQRQNNRYIPIDNFFKNWVGQLDIMQHPDLIELQSKLEQL